MHPDRVVTLLTDFGASDPYVAIMKGVLLRESGARPTIVDIGHEVAAQDVAEAAFLLAQAWPWFPEGSVHVAVVDPGVGTQRAVLLARRAGHLFLAPDNGLLGPIVAGGEAELWRLDLERVALPACSSTFHGRDVFAPAAARLLAGAEPQELGSPVTELVRLETRAAQREAGGAIAATIVHVDRFGNLVSDAKAADWGLEPGGFRVEIAGREIPSHACYADAGRAELLALIGSYGLVEVAVRDGDAARTLCEGRGARLRIWPL